MKKTISILMALALTDDLESALPTAREIAQEINEGWYSTQEAAFSAISMDRLYSKIGAQSISATVGGKKVTSAKSVYSQTKSCMLRSPQSPAPRRSLRLRLRPTA